MVVLHAIGLHMIRSIRLPAKFPMALRSPRFPSATFDQSAQQECRVVNERPRRSHDPKTSRPTRRNRPSNHDLTRQLAGLAPAGASG